MKTMMGINSSRAATRRRLRRSASSLAVSGLVLSLCLPAAMAQQVDRAEDKGDDKARAAAVNELPQVTVTATRSKTDLMKTPVPVTAISGEDLVRDNIKELRNLSGVIPNLQLGLQPQESGVLMSIRGISSRSFNEISDPTVGVHVDGVYSPRPQAALALMFDLDSVEVLRGAQGTLFGRGSTAGVINILPAKPDFKRDYGWTSAQMGNYNGRQLRTVYNKSLGEKFALRGAFMIDKRDGFITQERDLTDRGYRISDGKGGFKFTPNGKPDVDMRRNHHVKPEDAYYNADNWAGRLSARWEISPDLEWQGAFERFQNNGAGEVMLRDCEMARGTLRECGSEGQWHAKINVPGKIDQTNDSVRSVLTWKLNANTEVQLRNSFSLMTRKQQHDTDAGLHAVERDVFIYNPNSDSLVPAPGTTGNRFMNVTDEATYTLDAKYRTQVHELQLKQETRNWRYVLGLFGLKERNSLLYALDDLVEGGGYMNGFPVGHFYDMPRREMTSKAIFGQADLKLGEKWTATFGFRKSWDGREDVQGRSSENFRDGRGPWYYNSKVTGFKPRPLKDGMPHDGGDLTLEMGPLAGIGAYPNVQAGNNTHSAKYENFSYRLGLQYDLDKNHMVFASLATAYRPGGFTDRTDRCDGAACTFPADEATRFYYRDFDPEKAKNIELGYKGRLLNRKLDLAVTAFNTDYDGLQNTATQVIGMWSMTGANANRYCERILGPDCVRTAWTTVNIGKSKIRGVELEYKALPWAGGQISGYLSLLDAKVKHWGEFDDGWLCSDRAMGDYACPPIVPNAPGTARDRVGTRYLDLAGKTLPQSPKYSYSVNYTHDFDLGADLTLSPTVGYRWQSKMYFNARNLDDPNYGQFQKAYGIVNASMKLAPSNGKWDVEVWGTNLTNELVKTWLETVSTNRGIRATFAPPRQYGVRATYYY